MNGERRIATALLAASICLHVGLLAAVPLLWHKAPLPVHPLTTRYVVRMQQPMSTPAPALTPPLPESVQPVSPSQPMLVPPPLQPQRPQSPQPSQPVELRQEAPVRRIEPRELPLPKPIQPKKPMQQQRPTPVIRPQSSPPVASAVPQATTPVEPHPVTPPQPRQPTSQWQQAIVAPQRQDGPEARDVIQAYLTQVFAALERHKYYPATARRRGLNGRVVLQFIILPDGQVVDPHITEQHGPPPFSEAALTALRRASPLPAFPSNLRRSKLLVEVPIIYNLGDER